jgi:hypothetical protein
MAAKCRAVDWTLEHKIRSTLRKTLFNTKSVTHFEHNCALVCRIHVSFACNQLLARCRVTFHGSEVQSGVEVSRTEIQKRISTTKCNTKSETHFQHKCALVFCIHVSFGSNQQLARFDLTMTGSAMQSGGFATRKNN